MPNGRPPGQWESLRRYVDELDSEMSPEVWDRLRAESRVKLWLLRHDRRDQLAEYLSRRWFEQGNRPTAVVDGEVHAELPYYRDETVGIPDATYADATGGDAARHGPPRGDLGVAAAAGPRPVQLDRLRRPRRRGARRRRRAGPGRHGRARGPEASRGTRPRRSPTWPGTPLPGLPPWWSVGQRRHGGAGRAERHGRDLVLELAVGYRGLERRGRVTRKDYRGTADLLVSRVLAPRRVGGALVDWPRRRRPRSSSPSMSNRRSRCGWLDPPARDAGSPGR